MYFFGGVVAVKLLENKVTNSVLSTGDTVQVAKGGNVESDAVLAVIG